MDAGWFWAVLLVIPALIAACDGHRHETVLALAMGALAFTGGLILWPMGLLLALAAWAVPLARVARLNDEADRLRRHRLIITLLKLRVGVSDTALPASLRPTATR